MRSILAASAIVLLASAAAKADEHPIAGVYIAEQQDHKIELFPEGVALRGRIVWTRDPEAKDEKNNDPSLRGRLLVGIEHLRGFSRDVNGGWAGGKIYNPEDGKTYNATLRLYRDGRLVIQGRPDVPIIGGILGALFGRITYRRAPGAGG
jgi:uncharacterized protein (DUF2147 family)